MVALSLSELVARGQQLRKEREQIMERMRESVRRLHAMMEKIKKVDEKLLTDLMGNSSKP